MSRVINKHPSVSREAYEAVQRAMALLNYTPPLQDGGGDSGLTQPR